MLRSIEALATTVSATSITLGTCGESVPSVISSLASSAPCSAKLRIACASTARPAASADRESRAAACDMTLTSTFRKSWAMPHAS